MKRNVIRGALVVALLVGVGGQTQERSRKTGPEASAQPRGKAAGAGGHIIATPEQFSWAPGPESLPRGVTSVILEGDPKVEGKLFAMRLRLPAGTRIMPHHHGTDEHVTVIRGEVGIGMGEKFDEKALTSVPAGGFFVMPAGHRHFLRAKAESEVQLHGMGPWTITYVNPEHDPRGVGGSGPTKR